MFQIAVCDDDLSFFAEISSLLAIIELKHKIDFSLKYFSTAEELLISSFDYDILFLDICLNSGTDGIEIGKELRRRGNNAIFIITSSMMTRYFDGYRATVFRYLVKPLKLSDLEEAVINAIKSIGYRSNKIMVRYKTNTTIVSIDAILYVESYHRQRYVITDTQKIVTVESLDALEERLPKIRFYRPQKSFLIHLNAVIATDKTTVTMRDHRIIPFIKGRHDEFNYVLNKFLEASADENR